MTFYRLAAGAVDYAKAHDLMEAEEIPHQTLSFPTVMAWKENELTGFLSTQIQNKGNLIVAGPLILKSGQPRYWTLIRLIENYERVMCSIGIREFVFSVEKTNKDWLDKIGKTYGLEPYAERDDRWFYVRKF